MEVGQSIGRYRLEELIGKGGVATVYKVRHVDLDLVYALKVLHAGSKTVRDRLIQEGRAQAAMRHTNIVAVTDMLDIDGDAGLLMEYVDGPTLDNWLADHEPDRVQSIRLFRQIVEGIGYAHECGLVHRDLKPANIMLATGKDGTLVPKICDFGLVKAIQGDAVVGATNSGMSMGTPGYMAPEQIWDASNVDHRADMFSLGCIFYELICHRRPFEADGMLTLLNMVASGDYPPPDTLVPDLSLAVQDIIRSLLEVDAERRPSDTSHLLQLLSREDLLLGDDRSYLKSALSQVPALQRTRGPRPTPSGRATPAPETIPPTPGKRGRDQTGELVFVTLLLAAGLGFMLLPLFQPQPVRTPQSQASAPIPEVDLVDELPQPIDIDSWLPEDTPLTEGDVPGELPRRGTGKRIYKRPDLSATSIDPEPEPSSEIKTAGAGSAPPPRLGAGTPRTKAGPKRKVGFSGDATAIWLYQGRARYRGDQPVPPGTYTVVVQFGTEEWYEAGKVKVKPGREARLHCDASTRRCK